jgi:hypothetical protein
MLQAYFVGEVEKAFSDLKEKLPPDEKIRQHWLDLAKDHVRRELSDRVSELELRRTIELVHERLLALLATHPDYRH